MLFDLIRELNEKATAKYNDGMPGDRRTPFIGVSDGFDAEIRWNGYPVWHSGDWEIGPLDDASEEQRIIDAVSDRVQKLISSLYKDAP